MCGGRLGTGMDTYGYWSHKSLSLLGGRVGFCKVDIDICSSLKFQPRQDDTVGFHLKDGTRQSL